VKVGALVQNFAGFRETHGERATDAGHDGGGDPGRAEDRGQEGDAGLVQGGQRGSGGEELTTADFHGAILLIRTVQQPGG